MKYKLEIASSFVATVTDTGIGIAPEEHIKFLSVFIELKKAATLGVAAQGLGYLLDFSANQEMRTKIFRNQGAFSCA